MTIIPSHILQPLPLFQRRRLPAPPQSSKAAHRHCHQPSVASPFITCSYTPTQRGENAPSGPLARSPEVHSTCQCLFTPADSGSPRSCCRHVSSTAFTITEEDRRRIYIFGAGNKGIFAAYCLRSIPNPPPVTFLVNNARRIEQFNQAGRK